MQTRHVSIVILGRNQLVLAAREKRHKIVQEFARIGQPPEDIQFQLPDIPPQQNPMIEIVQRAKFRIRFEQDRVAEPVKRAEPHVIGALADVLLDAPLHFLRSFVGEGEPKNAFARQFGIVLEQQANALSNDTSFAGSSSRNDEQRPFAVLDSSKLLRIQFDFSGLR